MNLFKVKNSRPRIFHFDKKEMNSGEKNII